MNHPSIEAKQIQWLFDYYAYEEETMEQLRLEINKLRINKSLTISQWSTLKELMGFYRILKN